MKRLISWLLLSLAFLLTTALLGWWALPVVAAVWGALAAYPVRPWRLAALSAATAWAALLAVGATGGPLLELAAILGGVFALPGFVVVLLALIFPALLAWSAAGLVAALRATLTERARAAESG
ncbi:MAG: hypothetical protein JSV86_08035 [Gemmatimonadota bacterium]|nr:MAG: hypothetical protein JSV86_08035 [Gemmatimonadota bacterium]